MLVVAIEHMGSGITKKADLESGKNRPKMGIYSTFDGLAGHILQKPSDMFKMYLI